VSTRRSLAAVTRSRRACARDPLVLAAFLGGYGCL